MDACVILGKSEVKEEINALIPEKTTLQRRGTIIKDYHWDLELFGVSFMHPCTYCLYGGVTSVI